MPCSIRGLINATLDVLTPNQRPLKAIRIVRARMRAHDREMLDQVHRIACDREAVRRFLESTAP